MPQVPNDEMQTLSSPPVCLRRLKSFDVSGYLEPLTQLFKGISLQPTCILRVRLQDPSGSMQRLTESITTSGFLPPFGSDGAQSHFQSMRALTFKAEENRRILHIGLFTGVEATLKEPCPFTIEVYDYSKIQSTQILELLCLPIRGLRSLYLGADIVKASHDIIMPMHAPSSEATHKVFAFSECTQITSIYTEGATAKTLFKALYHPPLFPALRHLIIARDIDFENDYKEALMITWKVLHRTLTARREAGNPIEYILLPSDALKGYWVERMGDTGVQPKPIVDGGAGSEAESPEDGTALYHYLTIPDDLSPREY